MTKTPLIIIGILVVALLVGGGVFIFYDKDASYQEWQPQAEDLEGGCMEDTDCVLVQDRRCRTITAIDKTKITVWEVENAKQTEIARKNRQTCESMPDEYFEIDNFEITCRQSKCMAEFIKTSAR